MAGNQILYQWFVSKNERKLQNSTMEPTTTSSIRFFRDIRCLGVITRQQHIGSVTNLSVPRVTFLRLAVM
uniref:Putative ovule protein n=1 Tax=Solanum chacoense TaxID=4108 RepID=A0A0V0H1E1_SOLCH